MGRQRKLHEAGFKARVALAAVKGDRTANELAGTYGIHPTQVHAWKKQLLAGAEAVFANGVASSTGESTALQAELYEQIGRLKMELEWLKKKAARFD
jgi:putative transposase